MLGPLIGLVAAEVTTWQRTVQRAGRRFAMRTGAWAVTLVVLLSAFGSFVVAGHLALRLALPPIGAWLITGCVLLVIGLIAALVLVAARPRQP